MGRTPCCNKNHGLKKGPWTQEEDQKLMDYIQIHGHGNWRTVPKNAGLLRCGKSCRLRWTNYLRPDIKRGRFSFEEEETIIQLHRVLGNKWSAIAACLPGRTDNEIKNYWNTYIRKRLLRMGIDPVTHGPRLDLLDISSILSSSLYNPAQLSHTKMLGIEPFVNSEFLSLSTNMLNFQHENQNLFPQNVPENQFSNPQIQDPLSAFQIQQLQALIQDIPACSTSNAQFLSEPTIVATSKEQIPICVSELSYQNTQSNLWHDNVMPSNLEQTISPALECDYFNSNQAFMNIFSENSNHQPSRNNTQDFNFSSDLSTSVSCPVSLTMSPTCIKSGTTPTPLNSPSTYHVNGIIEDESDSYYSSMWKFEIPQVLQDVSEFM